MTLLVVVVELPVEPVDEGLLALVPDAVAPVELLATDELEPSQAVSVAPES